MDLLVSSFPDVQFGELHNRHLEWNKPLALQANKGDYDETEELKYRHQIRIALVGD